MPTKWQIEHKDRVAAWDKEYRHRPEVIARRRERERLRRIQDKAWRQLVNERAATYHKTHRDVQLVKKRENYRANAKEICKRQSSQEYKLRASMQRRSRHIADPQKYREKARLYRQQNIVRIRLNKQIHHMRRRQAVGHATINQVLARFTYHGRRCIYCKRENHLTIDHLIPIVRGGTNWPSNLVPACRSCNSRKHDKTYKEFIQVLQRERYING